MSRIFVGLPTFNGAAHLRQALESLCRQTYQDWTVLIGDNGSTDDTSAICAEFAARDARIRVHRHATHLGAWANFKFLLARCDSPYFAWFPDDYVAEERFLEVCVTRLQADAQVGLATTNNVYIDDSGQAVHLDSEASKALRYGDRGRPLVYSYLLAHEMPILIYSVFRSDILRRAITPYMKHERLIAAMDCYIVLWVLSRYAMAVDPGHRRTLRFEEWFYQRSMTYGYLGFGVGFGLVFLWRCVGVLPWRYKLGGLTILSARWCIGSLYKTLYYTVHGGWRDALRKLGAILHSQDGRRQRQADERRRH